MTMSSVGGTRSVITRRGPRWLQVYVEAPIFLLKRMHLKLRITDIRSPSTPGKKTPLLKARSTPSFRTSYD